MSRSNFHIGCAGWAIRKEHTALFATSGSHLLRYAQRFNAAEINSSFYRPHRRSTYERWAAAVPDNFAFAVKAPKQITHGLRLAQTGAVLDVFLAEATGLGKKLGPVLFQLPPRLTFEPRLARRFFADLRARFEGSVVCEPRHADWFTAPADDLLKEFRVGRVAADPAVVPTAADPGGWRDLVYFRLHGSPRVYYSEYDVDRLERLAKQMTAEAKHDRACWCIFDNTALGAATSNAFALKKRFDAGGIH
jgi:uncharacterized protein YecE (DUF72 family)